MPKNKYVLCVFTEGDCREEDVSFDTEAEREAWSSGFYAGAGFYSGDGAWTCKKEELKERLAERR
jgi:hypothetical protein